jgi:hypothetical protein
MSSDFRTKLFIACVLTLSVTAAGMSLAEDGREEKEYRGLNERFRVGIGTLYADFRTDAAIGVGSVLGTLIRVEDDLGLDDDDKTFGIEGRYRFNERHAIGFAGYDLSRTGFSIIDEEIEFDGNTFAVGAEVATEFDNAVARLDWRYTPIHTNRANAGFVVGLSTYDFRVALEGIATFDDGSGGEQTEFTRVEEDLLAPIPTLGMIINYGITPSLMFRAKAEWLNLDVGDLEGKVTGTAIGVEWNFHRHVGVGLSATSFQVELRDTGDDPYLLDFEQSGFLIYATGAF